MADYGSVEGPAAASETARPQHRKKCPSALVYGTLLSLALAGVALKGTPGGGFHSKKAAQLAALGDTCATTDDCTDGYYCAGGMCISYTHTTTDDDVAVSSLPSNGADDGDDGDAIATTSATSTPNNTTHESCATTVDCTVGFTCAGSMCVSLSRGADDDDSSTVAAAATSAWFAKGHDWAGHNVTVNVTKMTWAASDPVSARRWFRRFLDVQKAADGCNPTCECGTQGRVELNGSFVGFQSMFGLHTVDSFTKPSGPLALSMMESIYTAKLGDMMSYTDVMDFHLGLFTLDLDSWLSRFVADGVAFHALAWTSVDGYKMVSVLARVANSTVLLELVSQHQSYWLNTSALDHAPRRYASKVGAIKPTTAADLVPLWASRASSNATRDAAWYEDVMGASLLYSHDDASSGAKLRYLELRTSPVVFEIHFVERPADATGGYTIEGLEGYYREVHEATIRSPFCGFDVWLDNHIGVDVCGGAPCPDLVTDDAQKAVSMDSILRRARAQHSGASAPPTYRLWKQQYITSQNQTGGWIYNAYIVEPSGQALQLNGFLRHVDDFRVPKWNESLCGQGNCSASGGEGVGGPEYAYPSDGRNLRMM